jgi:hypothetical protein
MTAGPWFLAFDALIEFYPNVRAATYAATVLAGKNEGMLRMNRFLGCIWWVGLMSCASHDPFRPRAA